jgi:hypothetical protein
LLGRIDYPASHMSLAKVAVACGLVALLVSACGIQQKPVAGATHQQIKNSPGNESHIDDPRIPQEKCLKNDKLPFHKYYADGTQHLPAIQVGSRPQGPTIVFEPTAGYAQGLQMQGKETAAAVIGSLLVYPNRAGSKVLAEVRACAAIGVVG